MTQAKTLQNLAEKSTRFVSVSGSSIASDAPTASKGAANASSATTPKKDVTLEELRTQTKPVTDALYVRSLVIVNGTFIVFKAEKNRASLTLSLPAIRPRTTEDANDAAIRAFEKLGTAWTINGAAKEVDVTLGKSKTTICIYDLSVPTLDGCRIFVNESRYDGKIFRDANGYILFPIKRLNDLYSKKAIEKPFFVYEDRDEGHLSGEAMFAGHDQSILIRLRKANEI